MEPKGFEDITNRLLILHHINKMTWREIAASKEFGDIPAGTLSSIANGREPKSAHARAQLGLTALVPAPACKVCGKVHVKPTCPTERKPRAKVPKMSDLEVKFLFLCRALSISEPQTEYRFDAVRKWRFDFAWPGSLIAIEMEGGVYKRGRHTRGKGFEDDCEKYNAATLAGWKVLRFTAGMLDDGRVDKTLTRMLHG